MKINNPLRNYYKIVKLCCLMVFTSFFVHQAIAAANYPSLPGKGNFVVDTAHVINEQDLKKINAISNKLWSEKQIPIVVVTIDSLVSMNSYDSIENYTNALFNHWQLGKKNINFGVLLLLSINDRKSRIEFGAAWDHRYDNEAMDITQDYLVPNFRRGDYSKGMMAGVQALNNLTRGLALPEIKNPWWFFPLMIAVVIGIIATIVSLFRSGRSGWGWAFIVFIGIALWWMMRNAGSISGGGSGGGGGATGSW